MNRFNICSAISKSAITPSFIGRTAMMLPGVRPNILFASVPTASTRSVFFSTATTEGSLSTIPFPCTYTRVEAVPRSMARSFENHPKISLPKPTIVLPSPHTPTAHSLGRCQTTHIQHLGTGHLVTKAPPLFISENQYRVERNDCRGYKPSHIRDSERYLSDCKGQIADNGLSKPCCLAPIWEHGLQADLPFTDAAPTGKP